MKKKHLFKVRLEITSVKDVEVYAADEDSAGELAEALWGEGELELKPENECECEVVDIEPIEEEYYE